MIKGWKGFNKDTKGKLYCKDKTYEFNKEYIHKGTVSICNSGFHFCKTPIDTLKYGNWDEIHKVETSGEIDFEERYGDIPDKACCECIKIIETPQDEIFKDLTEGEIIREIRKAPCAIKFLVNPSEKVKLEAVKTWGPSIQFIKNPTEKVKLEAVKNNEYSIRYIKNPTEKVQLAAVKRNGHSIYYIKNPTEKVQLEAVKDDGYSIQYIKNPSEKVQLAAARQIEKERLLAPEKLKKLWNQ